MRDAAQAPLTAADTLRRPLALLIIQLLVIVLATQMGGHLATLAGQPAVIGEIAAGLVLGPSLVGQFWPAAYAFLFPEASLDILKLLSQVGVILFMFGVGLQFDVAHLRQRAPTAIAVSHFSIVVPFVLGVAAALALYRHYAPPGVPFHSFALFMGIALSITAFPVLARVIEERGLTRTPLGTTALACAAVDDVTAWSLLAVVVTLVSAGGIGGMLAFMVSALAIFMAVMVWLVRPWLGRLFDRVRGTLTRGLTAHVLVVLLGAALLTEVIGIHALFGAFLAGAIMPPGEELRQQLRERLESLSSVFLLPIFFAYTGLRTEIGLLNDAASWAVCVGIILTAVAGKLRRQHAGGALVGLDLARRVRARRADEHARPDGARGAERRLRPRHPLAAHVHDAGRDGARHDGDDRAAHRYGFSAGRAPRGTRGEALTVLKSAPVQTLGAAQINRYAGFTQ